MGQRMEQNGMKVSEAVAYRRSVRAFTDQPVDIAMLKEILAKAQRAPSGGNLQSWNAKVLTGAPLDALKAAVAKKLPEGPAGQTPEYPIYPAKLPDPYRARRFGVGEAMYAGLNIDRDDKMGRMMQMAQNFRAFDAPICLFVHIPKFMGPPQWSDCGMWMQTLMLLLCEAGLDSCAQEAWSIYGDIVRQQLDIPEDHIFFCGLAIGYRDKDAPINNFPVPRAPFEESISFHGFAGS